MRKLFGALTTLGVAALSLVLLPISAKAAGNNYSTASEAAFGAMNAGTITTEDRQEWYKITVPSSGTVTAALHAEIHESNFRLYDSSVNEIHIPGGTAVWSDGNTNIANDTFILNLKPGTYYLAYTVSASTSDGRNFGSYTLTLNFEAAEETFPETAGGINNSVQKASLVAPGKDHKGHLALNDKQDFYEFSSKKAQTVKIDIASQVDAYVNLQLYKKDGTEVGSNDFLYSHGGTGQHTYKVDVEAGNYVVMVENGYECFGGTYVINISTSEGNKAGYAEVNGGKFFESYGEIVQGANGLVQDPDNKDDWYFCANGKVQAQKSGLVQYPAKSTNWFYVQNGKLDTTYNGKVTYNGGEFFVARGKILTDKNGLFQDPNNKADWYFLANGQVQLKKTGIAKYSGAAFYVINGKLASDYTGTVTDKGVTYNVVKGRVR